MKQNSLFEFPERTTHWPAFAEWLAAMEATGRINQGSTAEVYRDMWSSFVTWCKSQNPVVTLANVTAADLQAFQSSRIGTDRDLTVTPRHARRLLGLIDRVLRHHAGSGQREPNLAAEEAIQAQPAVRRANAIASDVLPVALSGIEAKQLITFLSRARPRLGMSAEALTWQILRNRVSVGLQLGAGLTPGDLRALTLESPVSASGRVKGRPWKVSVPGSGSVPPREAPLATWAGELLQHWLQVRQDQQIQGTWLFPSTRTGKPWGKVAQYEAAKQVLHEAGLQDIEGGSFKLRHTFALRQLRRGTASSQVAAWLGIKESHLMNRYGGMILAPVEVV